MSDDMILTLIRVVILVLPASLLSGLICYFLGRRSAFKQMNVPSENLDYYALQEQQMHTPIVTSRPRSDY